jgi:alpha-mannosidase
MLDKASYTALCRLRLFRDPSWARPADSLGETIVDLSIDGRAVSIDLTPHEAGAG